MYIPLRFLWQDYMWLILGLRETLSYKTFARFEILSVSFADRATDV